MPLLKLWNSIRGRSTSEQSVSEAVDDVVVPESPRQRKPAIRRSGLGIFGGGPHAALSKLVRSVPASSVLEISVDDGSRAVAVVQALARTQSDISYFAIDPFETAPGGISVKQFHQTLRAENIRPKLFPGSIERGLVQVAYTVGAVDLVLISAEPQDWQTPTVARLLARVSHPGTVVLSRQGDIWSRASTTADLRRAA